MWLICESREDYELVGGREGGREGERERAGERRGGEEELWRQYLSEGQMSVTCIHNPPTASSLLISLEVLR